MLWYVIIENSFLKSGYDDKHPFLDNIQNNKLKNKLLQPNNYLFKYVSPMKEEFKYYNFMEGYEGGSGLSKVIPRHLDPYWIQKVNEGYFNCK